MDISTEVNAGLQGVGGLERVCGVASILICADQVITPALTGKTLQQMIGTPPGIQAYAVVVQTGILVATGIFYGGIRRLFVPRIKAAPQVEVLVEVPEFRHDPTQAYGATPRPRLHEDQRRVVGEESRLYEEQDNVIKTVPSGQKDYRR